MKILMLSWEYPPKTEGELSNHVYNLSHKLSKLGHEIHIITCEEGTEPIEEEDNGVFIHRVSTYKIDTKDFTNWVMQLNFAMIEEGIRIIRNLGKFDIIHAHDWLVAFSAKTLKWSFNIPMICTIHSTEHGKNNGIRTDMQRYISSTEWLLTYEASRVIVCSNYMKSEVQTLFKIPSDKICVIPNGVNAEDFKLNFDKKEFRKKYAKEDEKIICFIGKHVFGKGVYLLVETAPEIIHKFNNIKFVIAGVGPIRDELQERVIQMGLSEKVLFPGYLTKDERNKLYNVSNITVIPSLYEPFGIVALEAMAGGCPVVASDTGGLSEIVQHEENGFKFINGSRESLVYNICEALENHDLCNKIRKKSMEDVKKKYSWNDVGKITEKAYFSIID
ncbi:glycosyltransferase family 4 protein [Clostridium lundense]|uniref:glycosyltransferase family 4 protein n=1 Tax=Clostridium lundense TaxID=319475 RepID=UPI000487FC7D|nr:glycosyltransferase family 4 protein [Clostridium lundense]